MCALHLDGAVHCSVHVSVLVIRNFQTVKRPSVLETDEIGFFLKKKKKENDDACNVYIFFYFFPLPLHTPMEILLRFRLRFQATRR